MTVPSFAGMQCWKLIEDWPHRKSVDSLVLYMIDKGYTQQSIIRSVRLVGAFIKFQIDHHKAEPGRIEPADFGRFIARRAADGKLQNGNRATLRRLQVELVAAGALCPMTKPVHQAEAVLTLYGAELRRRGYSKQSISGHIWCARRFLLGVWDDYSGISRLTHIEVRAYLTKSFAGCSSNSLGTWFGHIRVLLRFLHTSGYIEQNLSPAVPSPRNLRFSALPAYMSVAQLDAVLKNCDLSTVSGRRDHAVLLLLSRLGLRASEVALLSLDDIDWQSGLLRVHGKGGRVATMPLPSDVGAAIADYILNGRPISGSRTIFHRVVTPCTPFATATPVILIARRSLKRAGITGTRSHHAHIFRHTFATVAVRSGVGMTELAQLLRHRDPSTTRIYAKFDIERLRSLSRPWVGEVL
ncbi:site-specific recombinase XerD [Rhizobium sp. BK591]|uniref:tyrosine-type recombinase/integrase n=1 Tax=Rhizobium sp. BK591 TaxID=2586985 RepID=UPI0016184287|nr:tyrosine-type recombinase/integrase [Rhizobium sp. BK591]MBB3742027.1 site-specific recombinase XerD [Rhizobium sp. BK591]